MTASIQSIISDVKRRVGIPANNERILESDYVAFIDEQLEDDVYPFSISLTREFYLVKESYALQADDGTALYPNGFIPFPKRGYGRVLREVKFVDTLGNLYNVPQITLEDSDKYTLIGNSSSAGPIAFYVMSDGLQFIGYTADNTGYVQFHYILQHPDVNANTTQYLPITRLAYDTTTLVATFTTLPVASYPEAETYAVASSKKFYDVYRKDTGAILVANLPLTRSFSTSDFSTDPSMLTSADAQQLFSFQSGGFSSTSDVTLPYSEELYLIPSGQSQFTILPTELDKLLVASVCGRVLETLGHYDELDKNKEVVKEIKRHLANSMGTPVQGEPIKAVNRSGLSTYARRRNTTRLGY